MALSKGNSDGKLSMDMMTSNGACATRSDGAPQGLAGVEDGIGF